MLYTIYDAKTGDPITEEVFAITEGGVLYLLEIAKGGYLQAIPVAPHGDFKIKFSNGAEEVY